MSLTARKFIAGFAAVIIVVVVSAGLLGESLLQLSVGLHRPSENRGLSEVTPATPNPARHDQAASSVYAAVDRLKAGGNHSVAALFTLPTIQMLDATGVGVNAFRWFLSRRVRYKWREGILLPGKKVAAVSGASEGYTPEPKAVRIAWRKTSSGAKKYYVVEVGDSDEASIMEGAAGSQTKRKPIATVREALGSQYYFSTFPYNEKDSLVTYPCNSVIWENPIVRLEEEVWKDTKDLQLARNFARQERETRNLTNPADEERWWRGIAVEETDIVAAALARRGVSQELMRHWYNDDKTRKRHRCASVFAPVVSSRLPIFVDGPQRKRRNLKGNTERVIESSGSSNIKKCFAGAGRLRFALYGHSHLRYVARTLCQAKLASQYRTKDCYRMAGRLVYHQFSYELPSDPDKIPVGHGAAQRDPAEFTHVLYARGLWDQMYRGTRPHAYYLSVLRSLRVLRRKFPHTRITMYMQHYGHRPRGMRQNGVPCAKFERQYMYRVLNLCAARKFHLQEYDQMRRDISNGTTQTNFSDLHAGRRYGVEIFDAWEMTSTTVAEAYTDHWGHHYKGMVLGSIIHALFRQLCDLAGYRSNELAYRDGTMPTYAAPVSARDELRKSKDWKEFVASPQGNDTEMVYVLERQLVGHAWWELCEQQEREDAGIDDGTAAGQRSPKGSTTPQPRRRRKQAASESGTQKQSPFFFDRHFNDSSLFVPCASEKEGAAT